MCKLAWSLILGAGGGGVYFGPLSCLQVLFTGSFNLSGSTYTCHAWPQHSTLTFKCEVVILHRFF